jgi:ABC-type Fe3+/spermidine/putrescine transport system ATPase subunit
MNRGKFVIGEPEEIYEHPTTRYSAEFIGSVNVFEGLLKTARKMAWSLNRRGCNTRLRSIRITRWWITCRFTSRCAGENHAL